ncbi:MAG: hypothetical protein ABIP88_12160 [Candidatus Binatia bacterium]
MAYLALATAVVALGKSVVDLIVAIIKARTEGMKAGDRPNDCIEVIIRRVGDGDKFVVETVLRIGHTDPINRADSETRISAALKQIATTTYAKTADKPLKETRPLAAG